MIENLLHKAVKMAVIDEETYEEREEEKE